MKYFFDTEFIEDGKTIDLISIGVVCENGSTLYLVSNEFDESKARPWVKENVISLLEEDRVSKQTIKEELIMFIDECEEFNSVYAPEFWADYCSYDWVSFCQIFGTMMDLPQNYPYWCHDIRQLWEQKGRPELPKQATKEHHALNDAWDVYNKYRFLTEQTARLA